MKTTFIILAIWFSVIAYAQAESRTGANIKLEISRAKQYVPAQVVYLRLPEKY